MTNAVSFFSPQAAFLFLLHIFGFLQQKISWSLSCLFYEYHLLCYFCY